MDSAWVTAGVSTAAVIVTAIYNTGGRGALERRVMRQELEVAALLPAGEERDAIEQAALDVQRSIPHAVSASIHSSPDSTQCSSASPR
jgi:hypothetical protein